MDAISYSQPRQNLAAVMDRVVVERAPTVVALKT
jgi:PHD/YefM family antitoxin component YafN of YafNO toxin-antitoxin module